MKRFLLSNPDNRRWIESQEKRHKHLSNIENVSCLIRRELYPELRQQTIQSILGECDIYPSKEIVIEAWQRQLYRQLMKNIVKLPKYNLSSTGKQTLSLYLTIHLWKKANTIFFTFTNQ